MLRFKFKVLLEGRNQVDDKLKVFGAFLALVLIFAGCSRGALVREDVAIRALEDQGFSDVKVTEHAWFWLGVRGGHKDDAARFTCQAKNPAGKEVTMYVFSGWLFGGATIRTP